MLWNCADTQLLLQALSLFQQMKDDPDTELDAISYSTAILACKRGARCHDALHLLEAMQAAGHQPTGYTYAVCTVYAFFFL